MQATRVPTKYGSKQNDADTERRPNMALNYRQRVLSTWAQQVVVQQTTCAALGEILKYVKPSRGALPSRREYRS
jgi:hypothetical protein